ncbi:hypothetical protein GIB67_036963 [Kingdonia uniflora]|uniref:non-specific serine/threonine protein kinase n=1 Tax=Kingdonia uniflora TaxID=39325 RepID=A0A7J7NVR5_9MAGN|nr:hypothetical protein GIB67_036963 [Kingdonia uniflora]
MNRRTHILICLISLYFLLSSISVLRASNSNSVSFLLTCGSTVGGIDSEGRNWESDRRYLVSSGDSISARARYQDPSLPSSVPYMSARIITSESTYKFSVPAKQRLSLRLYFYPSQYSSFNPRDGYFSVVAGKITLLKNFSASITAQALTQSYILKEFSLTPSRTGFLNLTFTPSTKHNGSFAFINGIEIVPMPDLFHPAALVGFSDQIVAVDSSTLQTMYRLNVGGQYIPPSNDSGLSRTWYDDSPYVYAAAFGVTIKTEENDVIEYPYDMPNYVAPVDVYNTARSMGPYSKVNQNYNLTWVFEVDGNFMYILRLHFCELKHTKINQRVFDIYINNQTAQLAADVIAWSSSKDSPMFKDFAMYVSERPGEDEQLWLALHPSISQKPEVYDAILNGLEIFKLNDTIGNLAGPNPVPSPLPLAAESKEEMKSFEASKSKKNVHIIAGTAGGAAAISLLAAIFIAIYQRKRRILESDQSGTTSRWLPLYGISYTNKSTNSGANSSPVSSLASNLCRHFALGEIKQGTKNFEETHVIGVGGFGKVYKGVVDGGTNVAIKRASPSSEQGVNEFRTEIEMLSKLRHRHLVSLIGFCQENNEMILVYDYMSHGTLREHLYQCETHLSWKQRLEICIGAARGLHYLHTGAKYTIIHRDVKTTNILVDENWVAKVSDFGLSKTGSNNQTHISTLVKGSFGYLDPEYFRRQQLTDKSDVYSFGVVLFEVLCAHPALSPSLPKEEVSLADWALHCQKNGTLEDIIDPTLKGTITPECLKKFSETAEKCLSDHGIDRPSMGDVLWNLEYGLQLQEKPNASRSKVEDNKPAKTFLAVTPTTSIKSCLGGMGTSSDDPDGIIFSQIHKQQGR